MKYLSIVLFLVLLLPFRVQANNEQGTLRMPKENAQLGQCSADRNGTTGTTISCGSGDMICYTTNDSGSITTAENCILGPGFSDITDLAQGDISFNHGTVTNIGSRTWHFANVSNVTVTP